MFTVCPKCALTLVVTAADLRVAQGYVRCGRCSNVFNALNALSDERQPDTKPAAPPRTSDTQSNRVALHDEEDGDEDEQDEEQDIEEQHPEEIADQDNKAPYEEVFEAPKTEEKAPEEVPEESLEFDPASTSVEMVFVTPKPGSEEATGTFEA